MPASSANGNFFVAVSPGFLFLPKIRQLHIGCRLRGLPKGVQCNGNFLFLSHSPTTNFIRFFRSSQKSNGGNTMQNWKKYANYRKTKNADGSFTFTITVDSTDVVVSEEIYNEYAFYGRKMKYMEFDLKNDRVIQDANGRALRNAKGNTLTQSEREISLDKLVEGDWDFVSSELSTEDSFMALNELSELYRAIDSLNSDEQKLIVALFFEKLTERKCAEKLGISKTALHVRKIKVLKKIKKFLEQ
jgi:RNA polymerase sigma factor (sigma-70 family)